MDIDEFAAEGYRKRWDLQRQLTAELACLDQEPNRLLGDAPAWDSDDQHD